MTRYLWTMGLITAMTAVLAYAEQTTPPAAKTPAVKAKTKTPAPPAKPDELTATVVSVSGEVQKRDTSNPDAKWQQVRKGETLSEQTLIRTGLGAKLVLKFSDRGEVRVKSGTKIGIRDCRKEGDVARMGVGLKYGTVKASVNRAAGPNDFRVHTPVATLSVRGSKGTTSYSAGFGMQFHSTQSTWQVRTSQGTKGVQEGGSTDGNLTPTQELAARKTDSRKSDPFGVGGSEAKSVRDNANPVDPFNPVGGTAGAGINTNPGLANPQQRTDVPIPIPPPPPPKCTMQSPSGS